MPHPELCPNRPPRPFASELTSGSERIQEIEAEVRHDVIAFTTAVAEFVGPESRWFHYGLTSNDVVDTAQALLIKQASSVIAEDLKRLSEVLKRRAFEFKDTPMVGRTHGIHAEPITFGFKLANWYSETQRNIERFSARGGRNAGGQVLRRGGNICALDPGTGRENVRAAGIDRRRLFLRR